MAKLPGRIPASQISSCSGWVPPEISGQNGEKLIRLLNNRRPGKMDLSKPGRRALVDSTVSDSGQSAPVTEAQPARSPAQPSQEQLSSKQPSPEPSSPEPSSPESSSSESSSLEQAAPNEGRVEQPPVSDPVTANANTQQESIEPAADANRSAKEGYAEGFKKGETEGFVSGEKSAYEAGFNAGEEAGRQQGEAAFNMEVEVQRNAISTLQQAFLQSPDVDQELQQGLVELITELTKVVVCHEVTTQPQFITQLVEQALRALPHGAENPKVRANPSDLEFLQSMSRPEIEFIPDAGVARGGCRLVAGQSEVEAALSERIKQALMAACLGEQVPDIDESELQNIESVLAQHNSTAESSSNPNPNPNPNPGTISKDLGDDA